MEKIITLDKSNIDNEHICCAISDKKCKDSYEFIDRNSRKQKVAIKAYKAGYNGTSTNSTNSGNDFQFIS